MNLLNSNFNALYDALCERIPDEKFKREKSDTKALFIGETFVYKMEVSPQDGRVYLRRRENSSGNEQEEDWSKVSEWAFDDKTDRKNIKLICDDFGETLNGPGKSTLKRKCKKVLSDEVADELFFANRMVNIFPELRDEISIEKQCYSEFRGTQFVKNSILPKITELLAEGKDTRKTEKLSRLLSDLYKSSSLNIKSLITMGILNNITDSEQIGVVQKYIDNNLASAWSASLKFKDKKVKPDKLKFTTRLLRNSSYK